VVCFRDHDGMFFAQCKKKRKAVTTPPIIS
jgi:hypothetical protein